MAGRRISTAEGRALLAGVASGVALVLDEPLSFWGGVDPHTGRVIDERHPQRGADISGRALVMPSGRGSSSSSTVLAEAVRAGHAPIAIVLAEVDEIIVLGALVAQILDGVTVPVVVLHPQGYSAIRTGDHLSIGRDGRVEVRP